ncbi:MAG: class I SAM-dependent methyltransferase [Brevinematia bacterium]
MPCKVCGSSDISFYLRSYYYSFDVFRCNSCGIMFRFPLPTKEEITSMYEEGYYSGKNAYSYVDERNMKGSQVVWEERVKKLISIYSSENRFNPRNILDVGCSFGGFLETAKRFGLEPYGVEISEYSANYALSRGLKIYRGHIDEVELPRDHFDIITLVEVIEHLDDPLKTLKKLFYSNSKGGIILIQTANIEGGQSKFFGNKYHYYLPGHLHYFSNKTLRKLLLEVGYKKVLEFYPVEFGLLPKVVKVYLNNKGIVRYLKILKASIYHFLGRIKIGDFALMSSMVMIGIK